jgi:hypothetical protein
MKSICLVLFLTLFCSSVFSQQPITPFGSTNDSSQNSGTHSPNGNSQAVQVNGKAPNKTDSSTNNLKHKINTVYKQLDKSPVTHKYINQIDSLKGKIVKGYKKIDSGIQASPVGKAIVLEQRISNSIKSKREKQDSINAYKAALLAPEVKNDSLDMSTLDEVREVESEPSPQEKIAMDYVQTASTYLKLNKTKEAIANYEKGLHNARQANSLTVTEIALKGLSDAYSQRADTKNALFYYKQYIETKDSLFNLRTAKTISELKSKYENEKKQREIQALQLEGEKKKTELKQTKGTIREQKQFITLIIAILCLVLLLTITIFRQYRVKKKNNELLLFQNNTIEEQKKELEESLAYTKQLQETLKEDLEHYMQMALRKQMNPHFIFNSLNSIQSFILQNDKLSANVYLSKFSSLMRKVLENSQHHFITLAKELEVLKLYVELEEQRFDNEFKCSWNIAENVDITSDKIPPLLLQPYIENAIWHGLLHKDGERQLTISIIKNDEELICTIEDNGIGRVAAGAISKNKIHHESLGTKITQKRIDLINSLNKSGIGVQYLDLTNAGLIACGTKVKLTIPYVGNS